jgi:hypothetical protein
MKYNCIERHQNEYDGHCCVIRSTWSFIRPMDMAFDSANEII